jgi:tripartite-type tricarboxylate transporter receptor subunit TctC
MDPSRSFWSKVASSFTILEMAAKNTPAELIAKLNAQINDALADPKIRERLAGLGGVVLGGSPDEFGKLIADETEKWAKVVKFSGAKAD